MESVVGERGEALAGREPEVLDALWREAKVRVG